MFVCVFVMCKGQARDQVHTLSKEYFEILSSASTSTLAEIKKYISKVQVQLNVYVKVLRYEEVCMDGTQVQVQVGQLELKST